MTYLYCKTIIKNKSYDSKEEMLEKLDVFLLNNRINKDEYNALVTLLNEVDKLDGVLL
ncbi:hypothetical protein SAMN05428976_11354 [Clostridium sp. USBA 49]|uniref:hypothetical protein n=1 Tax=Clostridium sp. USBA 49 TaxID=1881060 RepID=UPI0009D09246|nr:hypothetical protein [Clostridium sp. USBA 49]SKA89753.1 hypothetical protein SAMN05428976_11354 [Clostridium sp. USBA 49]